MRGVGISALRFFLIAIFFYVITHGDAAFSQTEPVNLVRYTEEDGLPSSQIYELLSDRQGYIWIGTINGLARFDGYEFKRFYNDPADSSSIKGLNVWTLFEDSKGRIWAACGPSILNVYDPSTKKFKQLPFLHLIPHPENVELGIINIVEDNNGRIYFGVNTNYGEPINSGLLYLEPNESVLKIFDGPDTQNIYGSAKDTYGNIWILARTGLLKIDPQGRISVKQIPFAGDLEKNNEFINEIKSDSKGHLWLISNRINLFEFVPQKNKFIQHNTGQMIVSSGLTSGYPNLAIDKEDNIWFGTTRGLYYFSTKTGKINAINHSANQALVLSSILSLNFDSFGSLWIGTFSGGLFRYDGKAMFRSYSFQQNEPYSITSGWADNMIESSDGMIWVSTTGPGSDAGINRINQLTGESTAYRFKDFVPAASIIFAINEESQGTFLVSTDAGLFRIKPEKGTSSPIKLKGIHDTVFIHDFFTDSRKDLWLCTFTGLYRKTKGSETFKYFDLRKIHTADARSNEITTVFESKNYGLWIITNNGLFLMDPDTELITRHGYHKHASNVFISQDINSFFEDPSGIIWVGTWQGGLSRYDPLTGNIKNYTLNDGLPSMSIQGILPEDDNKHLWLSTFEGLSRFNIETGQFNNFSIADGIQSPLFADASQLKTSLGLFIFGGSNGVTLFDASDIRTNSQPPRVFLTDLKIYNKSVIPGESSLLSKPLTLTKKIILSHNENSVTIEFNAIHYSNPAKNRSAYMLENYDTDWREVGNQHFASYTRIPPGEYIFRVKAANTNGVWNNEGVSLRIIVKPPWYLTVWAFIGYFIILVLLTIRANHYFKSRVIRIEREKIRLRELQQAREIERAYTQLKNTQSQLIQSEKLASLGELTAGIAHEIKNPLNFVINFSDLNIELIEELNDELTSGNIESSTEITKNIRENEQKINYHGKRADSIIKGMLQHSRSTGMVEPTNINLIADEYLRLSYHGLRAKDKTFNANIKTEYDESIGVINVIPQEIGRVILNLLTNAFYSVMEKKKLHPHNFEPTVTLSTHKVGKNVEIRVTDNGIGIPGNSVDKIFQPFYTTKPAGKGTGLGLSMSYDIITKGHGGELKVETIEGEGAVFKIMLPITDKK
jgi:signal transduction histidine kinase/ligand-binding sensor domain-containing protein